MWFRLPARIPAVLVPVRLLETLVPVRLLETLVPARLLETMDVNEAQVRLTTRVQCRRQKYGKLPTEVLAGLEPALAEYRCLPRFIIRIRCDNHYTIGPCMIRTI